MLVESREAKVFAALAVSMTVGVVILQALGNNPPSAGAFCLSRYTRAVPVEEAISSRASQPADFWGRVEIYYSGTDSGNIQQLAFLNGLDNPEDIDCHYVICNGFGGDDGQIQPTEKWQKQQTVVRDWLNGEPQPTGGGQTIFICVIADTKAAKPKDLQMEMTETLVEKLRLKFDISSESIHYPSDWQ